MGSENLTARQVAERIASDARHRFVCMKPEYDTVDMGEALITRLISEALRRSEPRGDGPLASAPKAEVEGAITPTGRVHALKTWPIPYRAVRDGLKPWELRRNDRDYQVGDLLWLEEWHPGVGEYTGENLDRVVTWKLDGPAFGLPEGYCIMSLAPPPTPDGADKPVEGEGR